jgi:polyhydroxyalkanoate synthase
MPVLPPGLEPPPGTAPAALAAAIEIEARRRLDRFLEGVQAYRRHPYRRRLADPPPCWSRGTTVLRDYGGPEGGLPVLAVPSLVNRGYVLDLTGRRSLMRHLARRGYRPFLVDWDWPGAEEETFAVGDYVTQRLEPILEEVRARTGRPPVVLGYCMGGLLALALVLRRQSAVAGFVALATPWDFHADTSPHMRVLAGAREWIAEVAEQAGTLPVDLLQMLFAALDPPSIAEKFRRFAAMPARSAQAKGFVALEDWLNDGVPLTAPVAREALDDWYGANLPGRGQWRVGGQVIDPGDLTVPGLVVVPARDRIVPPESARGLALAAPQARQITVPLGHIGMMTGSSAGRAVYGPLVRWLRRIATQY